MSTNNKKSLSESALLDANAVVDAIKEQSKATISTLLAEEVKNYMRDEIDGDEDEKDYEVTDDNMDSADDSVEGADESGESEETSEPAEDNAEEGSDENSDAAAEEAPAEEGGEEGDEWSNFDQYKVDDDTYDLTGVKDYNDVVKVYKLLKDEDNVIVKKDGDKIELKDQNAGTEYVIDFGSEDSDEPEVESEGEIEENTANVAGLPRMNENKNRKPMREKKEKVYEIDLGYTDNYQKEDPIEGLSNNEPGKGKDWDAGIPKGTEKPWAKDAKSKGEPYGKAVNEEENVQLDAIDPAIEEQTDECNLEEGPARTSVKRVHKVKSASNENNPQIGPARTPNSDNGKLNESKNYKAMLESLLAKTEKVLEENKKLKDAVVKINGALKESLVVNANLGKVVKLMQECTTTDKEKTEIINRFSNEAKTLEQSQALYESIKRELNKGVKQTLPINETSATANGSAINETKLYESDDLRQMKDMMRRMAKC